MSYDKAWNPPILVVEDDPTIGELLKLRLEAARYTAHWVRTGEKALECVHHINPVLIVLDLGLPKIDGFEVLANIRSRSTFSKTPIMVLTARHNAADVQRALALGANDYLAKPFDAKVLLARIAKHLELSNTSRGATPPHAKASARNAVEI